VALRFSRHHLRFAGVLGALVFLASFLAARAGGDGVRDALGNPLFPDLTQFYVAGKLALSGRIAEVYDAPRFFAAVQGLLGTTDRGGFIFVYPPFVAYASAPLALVPFPTAAWLVFAANLALGLALAVAIARRLAGPYALETALLFAGSLPFWRCLLFGQNAFLSLGIVWLSYLAFVSERRFLAGLVLSLGLFKPQVFGGPFVALALLGGPRALGGFALGAAALALSVPPRLWSEWLAAMAALRELHSDVVMRQALPDVLELWLGARLPLLRVGLWLGALGLWIHALIRMRSRRGLTLACALAGGLLLAPRLYQYDLALAYPALCAAFAVAVPKDARWLWAYVGSLYLADAFAMAYFPLSPILGLALLFRLSRRPVLATALGDGPGGHVDP
jgi:hypothetical protein